MASGAAIISMSPRRKLALTIAMMAATVTQVLDTTIANVALPHMQASLGATQETVAWVLTSYIIAAAIATPLTGWLANRFGRKQLFLTAVIGFTATSAMCGLSTSLEMMVASRALQGVFGAFIIPISQAAMYDINPREKHAQAMAIWGMAVMIAPILGPVVGGWLTDTLSWHWTFFINVPIGIFAAAGTWLLMPSETPSPRRFDYLGFAMLALGLSALQLFLDRGAQKDWLESGEIIVELGLAIAAAWVFIIHSATAKNPLFPIALWRDRNFVIALFLVMVTSGVMFGGSALMPPMLQRLLGYSTIDAGLITAPRGVGMMISMIAAGRLAKYIDGRAMIAGGLIVTALSVKMMTHFSLTMDVETIILAGLVQGLGFGFVVLPLNLLAFVTLEPKLRTEASSLYSLSRSVGGSIMISITTALLARSIQVAHAGLGTHITDETMPYLASPMIQSMGITASSVLQFFDAEINRQALMIAYLNDFQFMYWATLAALPSLLLLRSPKRSAADAAPAMMPE